MDVVVAFLKQTKPFNKLSNKRLLTIAASIEVQDFSNKEIIYKQHKTKITGLDIIVKGGYEVYFLSSDGKKINAHQIDIQDNYGAFSILLNKNRSINTVEVQKGTKVYRIPTHVFKKLCKKDDKFYQYFLSRFGKEMLNDQFAHYVTNQSIDEELLAFDRYFNRRIDDTSIRPIISCKPSTTVSEAAIIMEHERLSCLFVGKEDELKGYVTDIILRNKIVAAQKPTSTPTGEIIEGPIFYIHRNALIYEAILLMFEHKIRYLIVTDNGKNLGVISRNKLLSDQAQSPFVFIQSVRQAVSKEELKSKWDKVPEVIYNLLTRGVKAELVNQVITNISDTIALKVIESVIDAIGIPPAKFAFMTLGSEGRKELTLKTDQDNAIIYEDKANEFREKTRKYFLEFAEKVSDQLNFIGFSYCTGGLMAKNPKWTHSLSHWKRNYNLWIGKPDYESAMNFSTFFDCRIIYGEEKLITDLQVHILDKLKDPGTYFFNLLTKNALQYEPPLTYFRGIKTISKGDQQVFNIKRAMTPIVDLVRVYALKHSILSTNTGERLMALRDQKILTDEDYHELMQSYYYLMGMRLKQQAAQVIYDHESPDNFITPSSLTKIEIVTLKEIFKVIANFQQRIRILFTRNVLG